MEFKDLLELYKQGKYLEVIQNADGVSDFNAKFLKVRSYYALDRFVEALNEYKNNEEILTKSNFAESIRLYVDILVKLNYDLPQILIQLGPYYDYPNLNLEVKDLLLNLELTACAKASSTGIALLETPKALEPFPKPPNIISVAVSAIPLISP